MKCPVCGRHDFKEIDSFDICPICGWEDDGLQNDDHNYAGGANDLSVNEARIEFFLLNQKNTCGEARRCRNVYEQAIREVSVRYATLNRVAEPDKAEQERREYWEVRKEYVNALNGILQSFNLQ